MVQQVVVLGATGSIGCSTLDVMARHADRFQVLALCAQQNSEKIFAQCRQHRPRYAALVVPDAAAKLAALCREAGLPTEVLCGTDAIERLAAHPEADTVMAAIVGAAGLPSTLAAVRAGKRVLLANKEALVTAGSLFMQAVHESGATLLPIDSEHNAVFQSLPAGYPGAPGAHGVRRILLTASGGPFRDWPLQKLAGVTPEEACAHPNWSMGRKISVDSATMMNKGLEVIEAHWLFDAPAELIDVVIHRQSVIHSMVEYVDGSVLAQLGQPDMRTPIAHALAYPERVVSGVSPLDLVKIGRLDFEAPDLDRFPCLALAYQALRVSGYAPAVLNAANEVAVAAFLDRRVSYLDIARIVERALAQTPGGVVANLESLAAVDQEVRRRTHEAVCACQPA